MKTPYALLPIVSLILLLADSAHAGMCLPSQPIFHQRLVSLGDDSAERPAIGAAERCIAETQRAYGAEFDGFAHPGLGSSSSFIECMTSVRAEWALRKCMSRAGYTLGQAGGY